MNVKKYTAATMEGALARVKSDLGRDAVILHTRTLKVGGILGFGGKEMVEVTASDQVRVQARTFAAAAKSGASSAGAAALGVAEAGGANRLAATAVAARPQAGASGIERAYKPANTPSDLASLKGDVAGLRNLIEELVKHTRPSQVSVWPEHLRAWYTHLVRCGASEACAIDVLEPILADLGVGATKEPKALHDVVMARLAGSIRTAQPITVGRPGAPTVVAFVGPTGVGKTTTIAKLAAHFTLRERKSVGLITLDTYRIAAVEQLKTYARIIDLPLEVALGPSELQKSIEALSNCSLILMDTAGRSQRDLMKINDLRAFFDRRRPDQVHLVVSATAEKKALQDAMEKFAVYRPDRVLLTKLDEMPTYGRLLDVAQAAEMPVSYVTTGQDVPDDIEKADAHRLAALVAGEASIDS